MDRFSLLSLLILALTAACVVRADEDPLIRQVVSDGEDDALLNADHHFTLFKSKYGKSYATQEEHDYRLSVFKANLRRAKRHQLLDPSAVHGVTKFSDLTPKEFRRTFLGIRKSSSGKRKLKLPADAHAAEILPTSDLPSDFDWRDYGAVTGVKDQGSCGSCWSFSTTGALEGANFLATGELVSLSEQQLVDCDHLCDPEEAGACDSGCNGGLMTTAYEYVLQSGGLEKEKDYPYTGKDGTCKFDKSKIAAAVANFSVVSLDEDQIAANLVKHGPLSVGINAVFMQTYIGGVSCPYICSKRNLDHGVLLVGYGAAGYAPIRFKDKPYWIVKNSWGENWGEEGYYKICRGNNICGIDSMVSTVTAASTIKQ
ncbi:PREDICTED: cysteine proteinase 15A-like [Ipomoea nil]|uniref:Cysteine proteinase n=1 Tax=Ipomoea nil TaxID=35883 RepID=A2PZE0_IPONI|nr:PREDICTED: cysteine proteinase 15A-like [Ipomoea nil]BAF46302.1 cysteine proteinase precursor [Ipomoea nil]